LKEVRKEKVKGRRQNRGGGCEVKEDI